MPAAQYETFNLFQMTKCSMGGILNPYLTNLKKIHVMQLLTVVSKSGEENKLNVCYTVH